MLILKDAKWFVQNEQAEHVFYIARSPNVYLQVHRKLSVQHSSSIFFYGIDAKINNYRSAV
jgi:hypothetical protein